MKGHGVHPWSAWWENVRWDNIEASSNVGLLYGWAKKKEKVLSASRTRVTPQVRKMLNSELKSPLGRHHGNARGSTPDVCEEQLQSQPRKNYQVRVRNERILVQIEER